MPNRGGLTTRPTNPKGEPVNDLRDRIADALYTAPADPTDAAERIARRTAQRDADAVMPIVNDLAADLDHAERENRRLTAENAKLKR